jgi:hypothetical protein
MPFKTRCRFLKYYRKNEVKEGIDETIEIGVRIKIVTKRVDGKRDQKLCHYQQRLYENNEDGE